MDQMYRLSLGDAHINLLLLALLEDESYANYDKSLH